MEPDGRTRGLVTRAVLAGLCVLGVACNGQETRARPPNETAPPAPSNEGLGKAAPNASAPAVQASPKESATVPATPSGSAAGKPAPAASRPAGKGACASDADCRTLSSYCEEAPCACRVLSKDEPDPGCLGHGKVRCFADPCMKKAAACQQGRCVLVMGAPR